jgi:NitT/TauT family transport system substrate-binding protein
MSTRFRQARMLFVLAAFTAVLAAGCSGSTTTDTGSGSGSTPAAAAAGPIPVKVGVLPIADVAPVYYGIEKGYFKDEGLDVQPVVAQGGAAVVPSVISGDYQFGFSNIVSLMLARSKGVNVQIIANGASGASTQARGGNMLMASGTGSIHSLNDMAGKTFAVNSLKNLGEVTIKATLKNAGVDISNIQFVEIPFADMNAALQSGRVDVTWQAEPFITIGEAAGLRLITNPMYSTVPSMTIAAYFASDDYLSSHADVAEKFVRAIERSMQAASQDDAGIRKTISTFTKTPADVLPKMALPVWPPKLNTDSIKTVGDLSVEFGVLDSAPDLDALVASK